MPNPPLSSCPGLRFARWLAPAIALVSLAAACDGGNSGAADPASTSGAVPTPTAAVTEAQQPKLPPSTPDGLPPTTPQSTGGSSAEAGEAARRAFARWLGPLGNLEATSVASVDPVVWGDSCLEVPQADEQCSGNRTPGFRVQLHLGQETYEVHLGSTLADARWAPETQALVRFVEAGPNSVVFRTDDGGLVKTQPIPGTRFGVDPLELRSGDSVAVALASAPQQERWLLVALERPAP